MLYSVFTLSALLSLAFGAPTNSCPGGGQNGESIEKGRFWYTCTDGKLIMKGCLSEKRTRLNAHETFKSAGFVFECVQDNNGDYTFKYKGCVSEDGQEHMGGESWQDDNYWYTCSVEGDRVKIDLKGCIDSGRRLNPDETIDKGDLKYECKRYESGNMGWKIYPNHAVTVEYNPNNPDSDHLHKQQAVPVPINT